MQANSDKMFPPATNNSCFWKLPNIHLIFMDPCIVVRLSRNTNKMQLVIEFIIQKLIESSTCFERHTAHHQELYLQPLVYVPMWWPAVVKADNGRSPHGYINQRMKIQFRAPDDERCAARNMLAFSTQPWQRPVTACLYKPEAANIV